MTAVKHLPILHHSADYVLFTWGIAHSDYFENRILLKPKLGAYAASRTTLVHMMRLNKTESPIFVLL